MRLPIDKLWLNLSIQENTKKYDFVNRGYILFVQQGHGFVILVLVGSASGHRYLSTNS